MPRLPWLRLFCSLVWLGLWGFANLPSGLAQSTDQSITPYKPPGSISVFDKGLDLTSSLSEPVRDPEDSKLLLATNDIDKARLTINLARRAKKIPELRANSALDRVAFELARKIIHGQQPKKSDLDSFMKRVRYWAHSSYFYASVGLLPPTQQMNQWIRNEDTRNILLANDVSEIGIVGMGQDSAKKINISGTQTVWAIVLSRPFIPAPAGWRSRVIELVNQFREENNLPALRENSKLDQLSENYSQKMANEDFVAHKSPDGDRVGERASAVGYQWQLVLENLQAGEETPENAVAAWKASKDGHREAMLNPKIKDIGIGYYFMPFDDGNARFAHYWTLVMGLQK